MGVFDAIRQQLVQFLVDSKFRSGL